MKPRRARPSLEDRSDRVRHVLPERSSGRFWIRQALGAKRVYALLNDIARRCPRRDRNRFDDHLRLSQRIFIGQCQMDENLVVWRREGC